MNPERERLLSHKERTSNWKNWGPYLSERSWGTVREDESPNGDVWGSCPHDHARSKAFRWGEDGIGGLSDRNQHICLSFAFWNGKDPILKERLFGLTNLEGNHGEDVKELYYYLDATPTYSYMKMLYKYPQAAFPYVKLVEENQKRGLKDSEYEVEETGIFENERYFDIFIEYAKENEEDVLAKVTIINRGNAPAELALLPQIWFRNTWKWGYENGPTGDEPGKPLLYEIPKKETVSQIKIEHPSSGNYFFYAEEALALLFTENETNEERLYNKPNRSPYVKDAFHRYVIQKEASSVSPKKEGTKAAALYQLNVSKQAVIKLRLSKEEKKKPFKDFDAIFEKRIKEADQFYLEIQNPKVKKTLLNIQRQALAGTL